MSNDQEGQQKTIKKAIIPFVIKVNLSSKSGLQQLGEWVLSKKLGLTCICKYWMWWLFLSLTRKKTKKKTLLPYPWLSKPEKLKQNPSKKPFILST